MHYGDGRARAASIECATHNALRRADRLACESIALPALGCGVAGFALADGARIIGEEVRSFDASSLTTARFVVYGADALKTARAVLEPDD